MPEADRSRQLIFEMARAAMDELILMTHLNTPLWAHGSDRSTDWILNENYYLRLFPLGYLGARPLVDMHSEASRETAVVNINCANLVGILMDVKIWSTYFSSIVPRAVTLEVLSNGVDGNYNGALQVMSAEFQLPSPLVPTRKCLFVRYCKQQKDGIWGVVDVSLDGIHPGPIERSRKRPSGCLIQDMPNGYSKVTWVEHVEAHYEDAVPRLYRPLVFTGVAFGAKRWVSTLKCQCERLASVMASNIPNGVITTPEGKMKLLKLTDRMVARFFSSMTASVSSQWTTLNHFCTEDVRVMMHKSSEDHHDPLGTILNASTSFWLPVPPERVFDYFRDATTRSEWDILLHGVVNEMAHIATSRDRGNCVSLLRVNSNNPNPSNTLILQESSSNPTGSYIIFTPVNVDALDAILNGGEPDNLPLLTSGFAILPDVPDYRPLAPDPHEATPNEVHRRVGDEGVTASLLTVAFQIQVMSDPTPSLSLLSAASFNNFFANNVKKIKEAVLHANGAL